VAGSCRSGTWKVTVGGINFCRSKCPVGQNANIADFTCLTTACTTNKLVNSSGTFCVATCPPAYITRDNECLYNCSAGQYLNNASGTITCVATCAVYYDSRDSIARCAATCPSPNVVRVVSGNNVCFIDCPAGQFINRAASPNTCVAACPAGTFKYDTASLKLCVSETGCPQDRPWRHVADS
jgi:hypothetical protein